MKYLWNYSRISVVLVWNERFSNIIDNIKYAETSTPNCLNKDDLDLISKVTSSYKAKIKVNCTECKYCMPCPVGVNIPRNFDLLNKASLFEDIESNKKS